jgi:hypothetical protein
MSKLAHSMSSQFSSTAQDLARGKRSEIDYLNGLIVRRGAARRGAGGCDAGEPGVVGLGEVAGRKAGVGPLKNFVAVNHRQLTGCPSAIPCMAGKVSDVIVPLSTGELG